MSLNIIGEMLRNWRKLHRYTVKDLRWKTGLSESYIWQIENGKRIPGLLIIQKIAGAYGMKLWELIRYLESIGLSEIKK